MEQGACQVGRALGAQDLAPVSTHRHPSPPAHQPTTVPEGRKKEAVPGGVIWPFGSRVAAGGQAVAAEGRARAPAGARTPGCAGGRAGACRRRPGALARRAVRRAGSEASVGPWRRGGGAGGCGAGEEKWVARGGWGGRTVDVWPRGRLGGGPREEGKEGASEQALAKREPVAAAATPRGLVGRERGRRRASLTGNRTRAAAVRAPNPSH